MSLFSDQVINQVGYICRFKLWFSPRGVILTLFAVVVLSFFDIHFLISKTTHSIAFLSLSFDFLTIVVVERVIWSWSFSCSFMSVCNIILSILISSYHLMTQWKGAGCAKTSQPLIGYYLLNPVAAATFTAAAIFTTPPPPIQWRG